MENFHSLSIGFISPIDYEKIASFFTKTFLCNDFKDISALDIYYHYLVTGEDNKDLKIKVNKLNPEVSHNTSPVVNFIVNLPDNGLAIGDLKYQVLDDNSKYAQLIITKLNETEINSASEIQDALLHIGIIADNNSFEDDGNQTITSNIEEIELYFDEEPDDFIKEKITGSETKTYSFKVCGYGYPDFNDSIQLLEGLIEDNDVAVHDFFRKVDLNPVKIWNPNF